MWKIKSLNVNEFFKNAGFIAVSEVIAKLKGLIILPLLTHHFGALNYGIWSQVSVLVGTISPLIILGTDSAVLRYLPGRTPKEQRQCYYAWSLFILTVAIFVGFLIYILGSSVSLVFFGNGDEYAAFIPLAIASMMATILVNLSRTWFRIHNDAKKYALINLLQAILSIGSVVIVMIRGEGVYQLVTYNLLIDLTLGVVMQALIVYRYGFSKPKFSIIPNLLKFGIPLVPAGFAMWGLNSMDRLFLVKYSTLTEIGIYSVAYSLGYLVIQIIVNPIWAMFPNYAAELYNNNKIEQLEEIFQQSINAIAFFSFPAIIGLGVVGKPLMSLLTTTEFIVGSGLIPIIAIGYLSLMFASYYEVILGLAYRQYYATISITLACVLNLILNIILIPRYSITGAAIATSSAFVFQLVLSRWIANQYIILKTNRSFILKVIVASTVMGCCVYVIARITEFQGYLGLLIFSAIGIGIYALIVLWMKILPNGMMFASTATKYEEK